MNRRCFSLSVAALVATLGPAPATLAQQTDAFGLDLDLRTYVHEATGLDLAEVMAASRDAPSDLAGGLTAYTVAALPTWRAAALPATYSFDLMIDGAPIRISGVQRSLRADSFQVLLDDGDGALRAVDPGPVRTYRGTVVDEPGSAVRFTLGPNGITARIERATGTWHVEPLVPVRDAALADALIEHAVYGAGAVVPVIGTCGLDESATPDPIMPAPPHVGGSDSDRDGGPVAGTLWRTEIAFDLDHEFYVDWGSDYPSALAELSTIINNVDAVYESNVSITYLVTAVVIRTSSNDPYTTNDASARLCEFRNLWNASYSHIPRDVAHLMTGVNLDGTTVGLGYRGGITTNASCALQESSNCSIPGPTNYALSEQVDIDSIQAELVAHELGHNWNACHCDDSGCDASWDGCSCGVPPFCSDRCGIMTSCLSSFSGDTQFNTFSRNQIIARRDAVASCLLDACTGCCGGSYLAYYSSEVITSVAVAPCGSSIVLAPGSYCCVPLLNRSASQGDVVIRPADGPAILSND